MTLQETLIKKGYLRQCKGYGSMPATLQTTLKWSKMIDDILKHYGKYVVISEKMINDYIKDLK